MDLMKVFAIGNPFGLDQTLTNGIVSGLGREMKGVTGRVMRGLIQTDAAINPGNSGGPLLDARGRLIGVNTMIASPSGAWAGVGFAIPVDTVKRIVQSLGARYFHHFSPVSVRRQLIKQGYVRRAYLGIHMAPEQLNGEISRLSERQGSGALQGVLILKLEPGSPAEKALFDSMKTKNEYQGVNEYSSRVSSTTYDQFMLNIKILTA